MPAKVIREQSTMIQIRDDKGRSVAQIKLFNSDHLPVIKGLLDIVAPDYADEVTALIVARVGEEFASGKEFL